MEVLGTSHSLGASPLCDPAFPIGPFVVWAILLISLEDPCWEDGINFLGANGLRKGWDADISIYRRKDVEESKFLVKEQAGEIPSVAPWSPWVSQRWPIGSIWGQGLCLYSPGAKDGFYIFKRLKEDEETVGGEGENRWQITCGP